MRHRKKPRASNALAPVRSLGGQLPRSSTEAFESAGWYALLGLVLALFGK